MKDKDKQKTYTNRDEFINDVGVLIDKFKKIGENVWELY